MIVMTNAEGDIVIFKKPNDDVYQMLPRSANPDGYGMVTDKVPWGLASQAYLYGKEMSLEDLSRELESAESVVAADVQNKKKMLETAKGNLAEYDALKGALGLAEA